MKNVNVDSINLAIEELRINADDDIRAAVITLLDAVACKIDGRIRVDAKARASIEDSLFAQGVCGHALARIHQA